MTLIIANTTRMMVNTYQKGARTVKKGRDILRDRGWITADVELKGKYIKTKDLFGLFDVMAIKPGRTKLIQFKTNRMPVMKEYIKFKKKYIQFEVEVWCWMDRKGWKITKVST